MLDLYVEAGKTKIREGQALQLLWEECGDFDMGFEEIKYANVLHALCENRLDSLGLTLYQTFPQIIVFMCFTES